MRIRGVIDRRILANYRVNPDVVALTLLPAGMRPKLMKGYAIAGICLIRLKSIRPAYLPAMMGIGSENAAHRIAVEWEERGELREGVFIPRRDTSSCLNAWGGGRLFPGVHHLARFAVDETPEHLSIGIVSGDGMTRVRVVGQVADDLPSDSIFSSLDEASRFFQAGSVGYSPDSSQSRWDGIELRCQSWSVQALDIEKIESSFFDDVVRFPPGSVKFDCALLMRGIEHEWVTRGELCCDLPKRDRERTIGAGSPIHG